MRHVREAAFVSNTIVAVDHQPYRTMPEDPSSSRPSSPLPASGADRRQSSSGAPSEQQFAELERLLGLCEIQSVRSGVPMPLGAHARSTGVNFAIFSRHAIGVRLDLFDRADAALPAQIGRAHV